MQRVTRSPKEFPRPQLGKRGPLKIVLVYDGLADLIRAYEIWSALAAQFKNKIQIVSSAWNFALLRDPRLRRKAALHTAEANMIVLSASGRSHLPEHMRHWIRSWIPWKKGRRDALIAVLDNQPPHSGNATRLCDFLRQLAKQTGMDFFCNTDEGQRRPEALAGA